MNNQKNTSDKLRVIAARIAVTGMVVATVMTVAASLLVPDVNMVADTISDAAAGKYDIVQDIGLYAFTVALLALSYGMRGRDLDSWTWVASSWLLAVMAITVAVMAYWEGYSPGNSSVTVHYGMVYAFGGAFILTLLLTSRDLSRFHKVWLRLNIGLAIAWALTAYFFFKMGTGWDGLVERVLALSQMVWLCFFAWKVEHEGGASLLPQWAAPEFVAASATDDN